MRPYATTRPRQQAMTNHQVRFRPRRDRRQPLQELQRLEHQLARPVAPRPFQLQPDAAVAAPPQPLLREGRTATGLGLQQQFAYGLMKRELAR